MKRNSIDKHPQGETEIIWFNPPFSQNVKTNTEKLFFKLVQIFQKVIDLKKILKLNHTLRLNYGLMDKLQTLIKQHISKVLVYERNLPGYATAGIRTVTDWPVNA